MAIARVGDKEMTALSKTACRAAVLGLCGMLLALLGPAAGAEAAEPIPVKAFAQLRTANLMRLSPDGTHVAYLVSHEGRRNLLMHKLDGSGRVRIPPIQDADVRWFRWANADWIVVSYAFTDQRFALHSLETRLYSVKRDGSEVVNLIRPRKRKTVGSRLGVERMQAQIQDQVIDWLHDEPNFILLSIDADLDNRDEVRRVDVRNGKFKEVMEGFRGIQHWQTDQQGEVRLAWGYWNSAFKAMYRSPEDQTWQSLDKTGWHQRGFMPVGFSESPSVALASGENEAGLDGLYRLNLLTGEVLETVFSHDDVDFDDIVWAPYDDRPIGVSYTVHRPTTEYWDRGFARLQKMIDAALKGTSNHIVSHVPDKDLYLVYSFSDTEPGIYHLLDLKQKRLDFVAETMPGITPEAMAPVQPVSYPARDGAEIPGYLTVPRGKEAKNLPLIVHVHGGPKSRDTQSFHYRVQFLANRGYAVFQPNFRGSSGYGDEFADAGDSQWGGLMQDDVTDGVKWLIDQGIADADRICVAGGSYGGYAAMMGAVKTPDLYRCAVAVNGVHNLPGLIGHDKQYIGGSAWTKSIGLDGESSAVVSPYHRADAIKSPILIIHAKDDFRVPVTQARQMVSRLENRNKDVTYVELEDGDHGLDTENARLKTLRAMEAFLAKHLGAGKAS